MESQALLNYKGFDFFIKNIKRPIFQLVIAGNAPILVLKRMLGHFLKIPPLKKRSEFHNWKKTRETSTKKIILIQKLNQLLKTYKLGSTNWKTNKQKVLNIVLTSDGSWRAKYIQKPFSKYLKDRICQINVWIVFLWQKIKIL